MIREEDYIYTDVTIHKTFEISIMLNLETHTEPEVWEPEPQNIFAFRKEGYKAYDEGVIGQIPYGSRIPAVWLLPKSQEY